MVTHFTGLMRALNKLIYTKPLEQCPADKCPVNVITNGYVFILTVESYPLGDLNAC